MTTKMSDNNSDESLFPIAVLIDELRHEDVQVWLTSMLPKKLNFILNNLVFSTKAKIE